MIAVYFKELSGGWHYAPDGCRHLLSVDDGEAGFPTLADAEAAAIADGATHAADGGTFRPLARRLDETFHYRGE